MKRWMNADEDMKKRMNSIRFLVVILVLMFGAVSGAWAQLNVSDIEIEKKPNASAGNIEPSVNGREVTLTVTPAAGYYIKASDIVVEKLVNTGKANAPKHRTAEITDVITGKMYSGSGRTDADIISSVENPNSAQYVFTLPADYDGAYVTATFHLEEEGDIIRINRNTSLGENPNMNKHYVLVEDVSATVVDVFYSKGTFTGIFEGEPKADGSFPTISGLEHALFQTVDGGTVKNIVLDNVNISGTTYNTSVTVSNQSKKATGAIANVATGTSRIYNCGIQATGSSVTTDKDGYTLFSTANDAEGNPQHTQSSSTVGGVDYVGGLVGFLDGTARVINCYSYADITSGSFVGGIVGRNNVATTASNLQTMVMNCMFYGNLTSGNKAPIYNGEIITNRSDQSGVSNFNYFWAGAPYVQIRNNINTYNCALTAETRYLQRFEFFRHLLNGHRELAAWWVQGDVFEKDEMAKWVMEPSQIGTTTPYPILKAQGKYPSVVNYEPSDETIDANNEHYNEGRKLGTLSVTIRMGTNSPFGAPSGARLKSGQSMTLALPIIDKDPAHFNFNYGKVQLPYYNDYGIGNYTGNRVVTGWKIVAISGGTHGFSTGDDATASVNDNGDITLTTPYNFADRKCTEKDLFGVSGRVFNQGAYFDVPEGVTSITIEPYWAKAVFVADDYRDVVCNQAMNSKSGIGAVGGGQWFNVGSGKNVSHDFTFASEGTLTLAVHNTITNAVATLFTSETTTGRKPYDYAVVLVGNVHSLDISNKEKTKPYTIMSIDLDKDNEPDYSYILRFNSRVRVHPVRVDFLNIPGLGMAQKSTGGTGTYNFGIMQTYGWFESTNTSLFRVTQFEYDYVDSSTSGSNREDSPMILQGGVIEQWVTVGGAEDKHKEAESVTYYHVGGNVWFKEFHIGVHQDKNNSSNKDQFVSKHPPISVTGGDYNEFYLTGLYNTPNNNYNDNAECYINGGRFNKVAGTGMQGIGNLSTHENGNITWQIDNADINEFYGGGINAAHISEGNIMTVISNSRVDQFCGGPKFGNMNSDKKVATNATNCIFRTFFGAGYGGNSYNRRYPSNQNNVTNINWNNWIQSGWSGDKTGFTGYKNEYNSSYGGVDTRIDYQFIPMSDNASNVARLFVDYVSFSLATTHNVTSKLTDCTITTSPLGNLKLFSQSVGNFYGGGNLGMVDGPVKSTLTNCTVEGNVFGGGYSATLPSVAVMNNSFQTEPFYDSNLGAYLDAKLPTTVAYTWEHVTEEEFSNKQIDKDNHILYTTEDLTGLGAVTGNVTLTIDGNTTLTDGKRMSVAHSVYGGGEESNVEGNTQVNITGGTITENVFGGGKGEADEFSCSKAMIGVNNAGAGADLTTDENKNKGTKVTISNGQVNGNVYGGGEVGRVEWNTQVTIGAGEGTPIINGSVFGAGAGVATHGYAALVRGNSTVTVQGNAKVLQNVYGGGEQATVGRYWVKGVNDNVTGAPAAPTDTPDEMPYQTMSGGKCTVVVQGSAQVGPDSNVPITAGHVFGAGKGVTPNYVHTGEKANWSKRMVDYNSEKHTGTPGTTWDYYEAYTEAQIADTNFPKYVWEYFTTEDKYFEFLQTLALVTGTDVTIGGGTVKGSVFGGSESGYVQDDTDVKVTGGTIGTENLGDAYYGNVYGGGKGDAEHTGANHNYVAAGLVKGNTKVTISNGTILHNVYGGGAYGSVGEFTYDATTGMPTERVQNTTGGKAEVIITGGTIGTTGSSNGMIFGSSRGDVGAPGAIHDKLAWVYDADVKIGTEGSGSVFTTPQIKGSVYGGGENGHVFNDAAVNIYSGTVGIPTGQEIDNQSGASYPYRGNVYGAGCGTDKYTDTNDNNKEKYNPLAGIVQGNTTVNISGGHVVRNVYGAGAMGSVGTASVATSGKTTVTVSGGRIGYDGNSNNDGNIFGAARGDLSATGDNLAQVRETEVNISYATTPTADNEDKNVQLIAGSVFGGGEAGKVKGSVTVNMTGGLVLKDVYGGGALAHTQTSNWDASANNNAGGWADTNQKSALYTTTVRLTGGTILGEAYGGALGQKNGVNGATSDIAAYVYGDVLLDLNGTTSSGDTGAAIDNTAKGCVVGQVFGCNNINGSPKGDVMVHVYATQNVAATQIANTPAVEASGDDPAVPAVENAKVLGRYDVEAVYGGGNMAAYVPETAYKPIEAPTGSKTQVIIEGCENTSIETVYGGGNAAAVPETNVVIKGAYEIGYLFGGGNGKDKILINNVLTENPGADIGQYNNGTETVTYGTGNANSLMEAGLIHEAYGGSNTKGVLKGSINQVSAPKASTDPSYCCELVLEKIVGAGKYADIDGDVNMTLSCQPSTKVPLLFAGADEANVNGNITLNITNGNFGKVFGGNNLGGAVKGKITVNVEETGCQPIKIDELYLGGNEAAYSIYGYYESDEPHPVTGLNILKPRTAEMHAITDPTAAGYKAPVTNPTTDATHTFPYAQPELNIISCTYIGEVFGGGLGAPATMYANPSVNINMVQGSYADTDVPAMMTELNLPNSENTNHLGIIGNVYGGGDAAPVIGETHVNIGTEQTVGTSQTTVLGAYITGNVYGGGKLANVGEMDADIDQITAQGRTFVNIGAKKTTVNNQEVWQAVAAGKSVTIKGNVYGGGKGEATTFKCEKAIVAGSTNIMIGNGTVKGTVYGGGQLGRVETGTTVTIGVGDGDGVGTGTGTPDSEPQINGNVYGAGAGVNTHGYAALVRGISEVTIQGHAKVDSCVYGGGQIASVGRYKVKKGDKDPSDAPDDVEIGMPYTLADSESKCIVTVKGYAEIGLDDMHMTAEGGPDDTGYVFGAGKGVLPYEGYEANENPVRWTIDDDGNYVKEEYVPENEDLYLKYVETLALATETEVTIGGHAFVKGSVYGGSENGHVQHDTNVKIEGNCQIGNGWNTTTNTGVNERYNENLFVNPATATAQEIETAAASIYECAHWDYADPFTPYDKNGAAGGGATTAKDGHTFYGNVFGGGSGLYPYKSRKYKDNGDNYIFEWLRTAGRVVGNTNVIITGGHILTSVYGGCELTDVGNGVSVETDKGRCFVKMSGGTLGVPRTLAQIAAHPVTCYLFGAGKGDQRVHFNQWTNVGKVRVEINDSISQPIIYGSVFGGGEDGHVLGDVSIDIKKKKSNDPVIGTWGTSYVDGNVFGGGRGFGGDALTAGVVSGNVNINISGGKMLGSIYGGGRLGSVGTYLVPSDKATYGSLIPDGKQQTINEVTIGNGDVVVSDATGVTHGHVTINISGGTIGNRYEYAYYAPNTTIDKTTNHIPYTEFDATTNRLKHTKGGNVFAGAMGRLYGLDGSAVLPHWLDLGKVKSTKLTVSGSAVIKSSIYGGGELGWTSGTHKTSDNKDVSTEISITGGTIGSEIEDNNNVVQYTYGSVFGGGYGSDIAVLADDDSNKTYPIYQAGRVMNSTAVTMSGGTVKASVYGGGELANVGYGFYSFSNDDYGIGETAITQASDAANTYVTVSGGIIGKAPTIAQTGNTYFGGATMGNVYGGGSGDNDVSRCGLVLGNTNVNISGTNTRIYHNVYGGGAYGSVGDYEYATETVQQVTRVKDPNAVHTTGTGTANVTITGGIIGYDGKDNGMVFGSSRGDVQGETSRDNYMAWVNDANVTIGTFSSTTGPHIRGSVYGSGENGHVFHNTYVKIYSGTIGIDNADTSVEGYTVTSSGTTYNGPEYPSRGNVYGGGCGTDTYTKNNKEYFNPTAGIVKGNTNVTMTGGHVVRTVYGGGSMGSVGTFTEADATYHTSHEDVPVGKPYECAENTGLCSVTISGGKIGPTSMSMPNYYGNVFGAGRGEMHDPADYPNLETSAYFNKTKVLINGNAFVKGSVYGGAESGHVLNDTEVEINGNCQIGCGYDGSTNGAGDLNRVYTDTEWAYDVTTDNTKFLYECNSWPYKAPYTPYDKFADENGKYPDNSSADNAHSTGTDGHTFYGNVFGGGSGSTPYAPGKWLPTAGWVEGNTTVEIKGGHILTSVYGGNEMSDVGAGGVRKMTDLDDPTPDMFYDITKPGGKCMVKMSGGTLGVPRTLDQIAAHPLTCYLFGAGKGDQRIFFNKTTNVKEVEVEVSGGRIYGSVFGGGEDGHVMKNVTMTIKDNAYIGTWGTSYVEGNIFGGGRGFSGEALTAGNVGGSVEINIEGGTMLGSVYGGGRLGSVGYGLYLVDETVRNEQPYGVMRPNNVDDRGNAVSDFNRGYITINISGGTIGNAIEYQANPTATDKQKMRTTTFDDQNHLLYTRGGNVFAGCMGRLYSLENELLPLWPKLGRCKQTTLNITGGTIKSNVYGGAELGVVEQNTSVNITGGQVGTPVGTGSGAYYYGSVFGSGKGSNDNITYPSTTPEAEQIPISEAGTTGGNVTVHLNEDVAANAKGGIVRKVFGCNDMNGTPKGDVLVHIHATQSEGTANIATKAASGYDVDYVFGGGNNADYVPTVSGAKQSTEVIIEGCDLTSIEEVYGGGYGAATPGTKVEIRGTKIIDNVFGGGYGAGQNNPGANVGIRTDGTTEYGNTGAGVKTAVVRLMAGNVNNVYGGSNTKGDIRGGSSITNIDKTGQQGTNKPCCDNLNVDNIYGGGKDAEMAGGAEIVLGCMPNDWISAIYAGAENADVGSDVSLTLTSGKFERVFGGNKSGGRLNGGIEVNIEESGTCETPIIIGELYGGGNEAPYSIYGYKGLDANGKGIPRTESDYKALTDDEKAAEGILSGPNHNPVVNVKAFTSIGNIFGGGYGSTAVMVGNPIVNINEVEFDKTETGYKSNAYSGETKPIGTGDEAVEVVLYPHVDGKMGVIGNVFGGGNAAEVIGNTSVNIGTAAEVGFESLRTSDGVPKKTVVGADIRGNVYGGGNNAAVTGNTNVVIGKKQ